MQISLIQLNSGEDKLANFKKAKNFVAEAVKDSPDIIVFPENFLSNKHSETDSQNPYTTFLEEFQQLAKTHNTNIVLGSLLVPTDKDKVTNTSFVINRQGEIVHRYDKMYMYDVKREDICYIESDTTLPGEKHGIFELDGVKMGIGICVDIRFPEYFRELTKKGTKIVFLPSNFRKRTGEIAWDVLTRARALENQVFFCACGQTGAEGEKERCGNSRIISYNGEVIAEMGKEEGILSTEIDLAKLHQFRKEFPVLKQIKAD